jgi:preprotein translocase subunit SecA
MNTIWSDFARMIYNVEVQVEGENGVPDQAGGRQAALQYSGGTLDDQPSAYGGDAEGYGVDPDAEPMQVVQQRRVEENEQLGRNDPCWCGSGKKYKKCHGA